MAHPWGADWLLLSSILLYLLMKPTLPIVSLGLYRVVPGLSVPAMLTPVRVIQQLERGIAALATPAMLTPRRLPADNAWQGGSCRHPLPADDLALSCPGRLILVAGPGRHLFRTRGTEHRSPADNQTPLRQQGPVVPPCWDYPGQA